MSSLTDTRFELVRTLRNARLLAFSLGFPLILFSAIAAPNRHEDDFAGSEISLDGAGWTTAGWIVTAAWTLAPVTLAWAAYRRDTERV